MRFGGGIQMPALTTDNGYYRMPKVTDVEFIEQTFRRRDEDGKITVIERWVRAQPGEFAPVLFFDRRTGESVPMKMASRRIVADNRDSRR